MDKRVYLLTTIAFVVGMAELIIGGILDLVAEDLQITISQAGLSISVFALIFAILARILLLVCSKIEMERLTIIGLVVFFVGYIIAVCSFNFELLILSRIVSAASGSLVVVLCINLASRIVEQAYRGRAIGLVEMETSASLVLGLPIGALLGNLFQWRTHFILLAILIILLMIGVLLYIVHVTPQKVISL